MQKHTTDPSKIIEGISLGRKIVSTTFGSSPSNVSFFDANGGISINDGVKVIRSLDFPDPEMKAGLSRMRRACEATWRLTGDGTTSTAILMDQWVKLLYSQLYPEGSRVPRSKAAHEIAKMQKVVNDTIEGLRSMARQVNDHTSESLKCLEAVASIAMHNHDWAKPIAKLLFELGVGGAFSIRASKNGAFKTESIDGFRWEAGALAKEQLGGNGRVTLENPLIAVIADVEVPDLESIAGITDLYVRQVLSGETRPLVIVAPNITGNAMASLVNATTRTPNGPVKLPIFLVGASGKLGYEAMEDLSTIVGGSLFDKLKGRYASSGVDLDDLGTAKLVTIAQDNAMFVPVEKRADVIASYVSLLNELAEKAESADSEEKMRQRVANLRGKFGIIEVFATTETEMNRVSEMIEDCYRAVQSAMQHGVLPGAGRALYVVGEKWGQTQYAEIFTSIGRALGCFWKRYDMPWVTENIYTGEVGYAIEIGVLDNAASVIESFRNAWIEAEILLNTEYFIFDNGDNT